MRRFIYLDTDTLNSYIAQIYDGLIHSEEVEKQTELNSKKSAENAAGVDGGASLKLFGKGIEGKIDYTYKHLKETSNSELISDVQTKILHDNAFDQLMAYIEDKDMLNNNDIGGFIYLHDSFYVLDLDFYNRLFGNKRIVDFFKSSEQEKNEQELKVLQEFEKNQPDANVNEINLKYTQLLKKRNQQTTENYDRAKEIFEIIDSIIPYKKTLCISNNMVVLNPKYFRDDLDVMSFKFGGQINVLGYLTNRISQEEKESDNPLGNITSAVNEIMMPLFSKEEELNIVHPIAIYYE